MILLGQRKQMPDQVAKELARQVPGQRLEPVAESTDPSVIRMVALSPQFG